MVSNSNYNLSSSEFGRNTSSFMGMDKCMTYNGREYDVQRSIPFNEIGGETRQHPTTSRTRYDSDDYPDERYNECKLHNKTHVVFGDEADRYYPQQTDLEQSNPPSSSSTPSCGYSPRKTRSTTSKGRILPLTPPRPFRAVQHQNENSLSRTNSLPMKQYRPLFASDSNMVYYDDGSSRTLDRQQFDRAVRIKKPPPPQRTDDPHVTNYKFDDDRRNVRHLRKACEFDSSDSSVRFSQSSQSFTPQQMQERSIGKQGRRYSGEEAIHHPMHYNVIKNYGISQTPPPTRKLRRSLPIVEKTVETRGGSFKHGIVDAVRMSSDFNNNSNRRRGRGFQDENTEEVNELFRINDNRIAAGVWQRGSASDMRQETSPNNHMPSRVQSSIQPQKMNNYQQNTNSNNNNSASWDDTRYNEDDRSSSETSRRKLPVIIVTPHSSNDNN